MARKRVLCVAVAASLIGLAVLGASAWRPHDRGDGRGSWEAGALPDPDTASLDALHEAYGPKQYSQEPEETLIRAFFRDRREGSFVDVGASHYYLERHLDWHGIAINTHEACRADYQRFRPRTRFFAVFLTNRAGQQTDFYVRTADARISSGTHDRLPSVRDRNVEAIRVPSTTLDHLLTAERVNEVDFVSLGIEGFEPEALEGFDLERYRPELLCVKMQTHAGQRLVAYSASHQMQTRTRARLVAYFAPHQYVPIEQYRHSDSVNLYFRRRQ
jgi:FkbM family methyltransferase